MKRFFLIGMFFLAPLLFASAPLEGGFFLAPRASAPQDDKEKAYIEARRRVINSAIKYENTPYLYGGMTSRGLDCSGLICLSFQDALGVTLPRSASSLYSWTQKIPLDKAQPGDMLFFKTDNTGKITHVALYLGGQRFIHSASSGPQTGVIYSSLDERYWARAYAGAGRAFPEAKSDFQIVLANSVSSDGTVVSANSGSLNEAVISSGGNWSPGVQPDLPPGAAVSSSPWNGRLLFGAAFAPTWNGFLKGGSAIRGFTSQFRLGYDTSLFGTRMLLGLEMRPEYDGALGVFRLPLTFSWGSDDRIRVFAGPVLSIGKASLSTDDGERLYSGGTSWLGTIGITAAPFILSTSKGDFAPYVEAAWQSYFSDNPNFNFSADLSAGLRLSTGIRWTMEFR